MLFRAIICIQFFIKKSIYKRFFYNFTPLCALFTNFSVLFLPVSVIFTSIFIIIRKTT